MSNEKRKNIANTIMTQAARDTATGCAFNIHCYNLSESNCRITSVIDSYHTRYQTMFSSLLKLTESEDLSLEVRNSARALLVLTQTDYSADLFLLPSIEQKGKFAYSRNAEDTDAQRIVTTLGRIMRRQLFVSPEQVGDEVIGKIAASLIESLWPSVENVVRVYGREIISAYEVYSGISCMSGDDARFVEIYKYNPQVVSLLTVSKGGECVAKALLWDIPKSGLYLDRVYHHRDNFPESQSIIAYARILNADIASNCYCGRCEGNTSVDLDVSNCTYLPYMDSFQDGFQKNNILTLRNSSEGEMTTIDGSGLAKCSSCGKYSFAYSCSCAYCDGRIEQQANCDGCNEYYGIDSLTYISRLEISVCECCMDDYRYCNDCEEYFYQDDMVYVSDTEENVCDSCIDNYAYCHDCHEYFLQENVTHIAGINDHVCESCLIDYEYCDNCDKYYQTGEMTYIEDENINVCESCLEDYSLCDDCNEYFADITHIDNKGIKVCGDCLESYTKCDQCDDYSSKDDIVMIKSTSEYVCKSCRKHHYFKCEYCDNIKREEDKDSTEGEEMCSDCVNVLEAV